MAELAELPAAGIPAFCAVPDRFPAGVGGEQFFNRLFILHKTQHCAGKLIFKSCEHYSYLPPQGMADVRAFRKIGPLTSQQEVRCDLFLVDEHQWLYPRNKAAGGISAAVPCEARKIPTEDVHKDRLCLVIEVVAGGKAGGPRTFRTGCQGFLPQDTADAAGLLFPALEDPVERISEQFHKRDSVVFYPKRGDESISRTDRFLAITGNSFVDGYCNQADIIPSTKDPVQEEEKCGAVFAAAQAYRDAVSRNERVLFPHRGGDPLFDITGEMRAAEVAVTIPLEDDGWFRAEGTGGSSRRNMFRISRHGRS